MAGVKWVNLIPYPKGKYQTGDHTVYLVHSHKDRIYKIGWTADLVERMKHLPHINDQRRIARPPYTLIHTISTHSGGYLERQLHLLFRHRHARNEWFYLTTHDVQWIIDLGSHLPNGIPVDTDIVPPLAEEDTLWRS